MTTRSAIELRYATCALDCPSACALEVRVEGGRLRSIRGQRDHPFTRGTICRKVARYAELQEGERVLEPQLRDGPKGAGCFRPVSWEQALDHVAARLQEVERRHGPQSVLPFCSGGTQGVVQQRAMDRLANRAGWSRLGHTICMTPAGAGWKAGVGALTGPPPQELAESDLVVLWGLNAVSTHLNLMRFVAEARRSGARLVVIDPYRTRTARVADLHLAPRPGTDGALACALMSALLERGRADRGFLAQHTDFDDEAEAHLRARTPEWAAPITGIEAARVRRFADEYASAARPYIRVGVGMCRHPNGAVNVHAVSCLPALVGAWRHRGAGALLATSDAFNLDHEPVRQERWAHPGVRTLDMSQLGRWLTDTQLDPPVAALLVQNANPAGSCPELGLVHAGLRREDLFTVVHELVESDTARFADVLLPATSFLEHPDLYKSYGQCTLQYADRALPPRGQARPNHEVVNALARRLGYTDPAFEGDSQEMIDRVLAASALPTRAELARRRWLDLTPDEDAAHFRAGFPQPDGRFHFRPAWSRPELPRLPDHWPVNARDRETADPGRHLDLMLPPAHDVLNTTFTTTPSVLASHRPDLLMHPEDAAERGIVDGARVRVRGELAALTMTARLSDVVRPGLCVCESNHLARAFPEGISLNALADATPVAPDGGVAFHDIRVEVELA